MTVVPTLEFVTRVDWRTAINSLVTVDGEKVNYVPETTDSSYDSANKAVINFGAPRRWCNYLTLVIMSRGTNI